MGILCRLTGHRWSIKGLSSGYEWCSRCRARREQDRQDLWLDAEMGEMLVGDAVRRGLTSWDEVYAEAVKPMSARFMPSETR